MHRYDWIMPTTSPVLEVKVKVRCTLRKSEATGLFVASCPTLQIKSQGTTQEQAKASIDDAVRLFVVHCLRRGILEEVLKNRGFAPVDSAFGGEDRSVDDDVISVSEPLLEWDSEMPVSFHTTPKAGSAQWLQ